MTVVQCYAPSNDALDDQKGVVTRQSNKGITLLVGDLNAKDMRKLWAWKDE